MMIKELTTDYKDLSIQHAFEAFSFLFQDGGFTIQQEGALKVCTSRINTPLLNCVLKYDTAHDHDYESVFNWIQSSKVPHIFFHDVDSQALPASFLDNPKTAFIQNFTLVHSELTEHAMSPHVARVQSEKELELFGQIADICFNLPNTSTYQFLKPLKEILNEDYSFKPYLYYLDHQPVGTIALITSTTLQAAGAYWGAVLPEYRTQGIATTLLHHICHEAKMLGYQHMISQCADTSLGIALKEGFSKHGELAAYLINPE